MNETTIVFEKPDCVVTLATAEDAADFLLRLEGGVPKRAGGGARRSVRSVEPSRGARPRKPRAAAPREEAPTEGRGRVKAQVVAFVAKHPQVQLAELAMVLYGDDSPPARNKARLNLGNAVKSGALKRLAKGEYRVAS